MIGRRKARRIEVLENRLDRLALGVQDFSDVLVEFCERWEVSAGARLDIKERARWAMLRRETQALAELAASVIHDPEFGLRYG